MVSPEQPGGATPTPDPAGSTPAGLEALEHQWSVRAADGVDVVVTTVRDRVVRPILLVARALVFGAIILVAGAVMLILLSVGLLRLLDVYAFPGRVWASYLLLGVVFSLAGLLVWTRRTDRA